MIFKPKQKVMIDKVYSKVVDGEATVISWENGKYKTYRVMLDNMIMSVTEDQMMDFNDYWKLFKEGKKPFDKG